MAGVYENPIVGYHDSNNNMPISDIDAAYLFLHIEYDSERRHFIPNCQAVWDALGVKMTNDGLVRIKKSVHIVSGKTEIDVSVAVDKMRNESDEDMPF